MESFVGWGVGIVILYLLLTRKRAKKPVVGPDGSIRDAQGYRIVGPDDLVIPAALLLQRGAAEFQKDINKSMQRVARGGTEGAARGPEEESDEPERLEH